MDKYQNKYRIPSARANWHDYNGGVYFVTICTKNRKHYFGEIVANATSQIIQLSEIGHFTEDCISKMESLHANISIPLYQIMPNHIHMIIVVETSNSHPTFAEKHYVETSYYGVSTVNDYGVSTVNETMHNIAIQCGRLSYVITQFKSAVTKFTRQSGYEFAWQSRFHDRIVRNQDELDRISIYIKNNVEFWHDDELM